MHHGEDMQSRRPCPIRTRDAGLFVHLTWELGGVGVEAPNSDDWELTFTLLDQRDPDLIRRTCLLGADFSHVLMALTRSFTFPLSRAEECSRIPPFFLEEDDAGRLLSCRAFQAIRGFLTSRVDDCFCVHHQPTSKAHEEAWLLQRDITYALILPLLEIQRYATHLAISVLGDRNIFDLELVFRGEARGAFAWLQCFIAEEEEWCSTQGCPACVVSHVLEAEPTIRIIVTACRLAASLRRPSDPMVGEDSIPLPVFDFWLSSLRTALDEDPFWGPNIWKELEPRASNLENGIHQMVRQCMEFEEMQATKTVQQPEGAPVSASVGNAGPPAQSGTYRSDGKVMVLVSEENIWMQKIVLGCWTTLLADTANVGRMPAIVLPSNRRPVYHLYHGL